MSPEKNKPPALKTVSTFASDGRYLDDDKWLNEFQTTFQEMSNNLGIEFSPQTTPALIYATRSDIASAVSEAHLPLLDGKESTKAVIAELIDLKLIDELIALSGITMTIKSFLSRAVQHKGDWNHSVNYFDIRASLVDLPALRGRDGSVISNETLAVQRAFGVRPSPIDEFGIPVIEVRLGAIASSKKFISEIPKKQSEKLLYKLPKKLTLAPLSRLQ